MKNEKELYKQVIIQSFDTQTLQWYSKNVDENIDPEELKKKLYKYFPQKPKVEKATNNIHRNDLYKKSNTLQNLILFIETQVNILRESDKEDHIKQVIYQNLPYNIKTKIQIQDVRELTQEMFITKVLTYQQLFKNDYAKQAKTKEDNSKCYICRREGKEIIYAKCKKHNKSLQTSSSSSSNFENENSQQ